MSDLEDGDDDARWRAVVALVTGADDRATPLLRRVALDPREDEAIQAHAWEALANLLSPQQHLDQLAPGLSEPDPAIRRLAAGALACHGGAVAVPTLVALARDPDPSIRTWALRGLARHRGPEDVLLGGLVDPVPEVRIAAAVALLPLQPDAASLLAQLEDPDPGVRAAVCRHLIRAPRDAALQPLLALATDPAQPDTLRCSAVEALGGLMDPRAVEPLIALLADPGEVPEVRSNAAAALGDHGDLRGLEPLARYLRQDTNDPYDHAMAAVALGHLGDPAGVPPLQQALSDPREPVVEAAIDALGQLRATGATPQLLSLLQDGAYAEAAAFALGQIGAREAVAPLLEALSDPGGPHAEAAFALGQLGDPSAVDAIVDLWRGSDPPHLVAFRTVVALGQLGGGAAVLERALHHERHDVVVAAARALATLGDPGAVSAIRSAVPSPRPPLVLGALAQLGDPEARHTLRARLEDPAASDQHPFLAFELARLGEPDVLEACLSAQQSRYDNVRRDALDALVRIGGERARQGVIAALSDPIWSVRSHARAILRDHPSWSP